LFALHSQVDAATRKKGKQEETLVEAEAEVKKDISDMGAKKLAKMKALQSASPNGVINLTVNDYK
jgi:hypothetical protein